MTPLISDSYKVVRVEFNLMGVDARAVLLVIDAALMLALRGLVCAHCCTYTVNLFLSPTENRMHTAALTLLRNGLSDLGVPRLPFLQKLFRAAAHLHKKNQSDA